MTPHPLQHLFDQAERQASEPCPSCGCANVKNWSECAGCGLCREGWLTGSTGYYRERVCPECKESIRSEGTDVGALAVAECGSEWCGEVLADNPGLRRIPVKRELTDRLNWCVVNNYGRSCLDSDDREAWQCCGDGCEYTISDADFWAGRSMDHACPRGSYTRTRKV